MLPGWSLNIYLTSKKSRLVYYSGVKWRAMLSPCSTCHNWSSCSTFLTRSAKGNLVWPSHEAVTSSVFRENIITPPNIFCFANSACVHNIWFHIGISNNSCCTSENSQHTWLIKILNLLTFIKHIKKYYWWTLILLWAKQGQHCSG